MLCLLGLVIAFALGALTKMVVSRKRAQWKEEDRKAEEWASRVRAAVRLAEDHEERLNKVEDEVLGPRELFAGWQIRTGQTLNARVKELEAAKKRVKK